VTATATTSPRAPRECPVSQAHCVYIRRRIRPPPAVQTTRATPGRGEPAPVTPFPRECRISHPRGKVQRIPLAISGRRSP
jgi:hypothetical protein